MKRAVFLDRDGVLIEDVDLLTRPEQVRLLPGVPEALCELQQAGFQLVVVSNQSVVSRGLATEDEVRRLNEFIQEQLTRAGGPHLDSWYFCPHHPNATLSAYRQVCECRKPRPGMFRQAARELEIDLGRSFTVGDRITDIIAGAAAGCRTVLVETGKHLEPPIETADPLDTSTRPDYLCPNLAAAAAWIVKSS